MSGAPGYWMNETSGVLRPVVERYLNGSPMSEQDISIMAAYLKQWVDAPGFYGSDVEFLRITVGSILSRSVLESWLDRALEAGIDPL